MSELAVLTERVASLERKVASLGADHAAVFRRLDSTEALAAGVGQEIEKVVATDRVLDRLTAAETEIGKLKDTRCPNEIIAELVGSRAAQDRFIADEKAGLVSAVEP